MEVVVTPEAGATDKEIQAAIDAVVKAGGGRVAIKPGEYALHRGLLLQNAKDVSLIGGPGVKLKFAPEVCVIAAADAPKGQDFVEVESAEKIAAGMGLEIQANGRLEITPSGSKYQVPYFMAGVAAVEGAKIKTRRPLQYAVPKGTKMVFAYNAFTIGGRSSNITLADLEVDLNRDQWPVKPIDRTSHCAVLGAGAYDYKKGVTGAAVEGVVIRNCVFRNCHHRGVAWYSVVKSSVTGCRIENTGAEGIDFDHFNYHCEARDNEIRNCPVGIELNDASDCILEGNKIESCGTGINLWRWCPHEDLNLNNLFKANTLLNIKGTAISCGAKTGKTTITGNTIQGCGGFGMQIAGDENTVTDNIVRGCGKEPIFLSGNRNALRGNDVKENKMPVKDTGKENRLE